MMPKQNDWFPIPSENRQHFSDKKEKDAQNKEKINQSTKQNCI